METYDVYTDGSFRGGRFTWAYVFVEDDGVALDDSGISDPGDEAASMWNVAGEIRAAVMAVEKAIEIGVRIRLHYDYAGVEAWATGKWKANKQFTREYAEFTRQHKNRIEFIKVKGHSGNKWNDYVDKLAKQALEEI